MKEIFDKTHVIEEENASLKDEASKLNQERVALIEEKDSLSLEKRELDTAVSKLNSKLAEISACIEEAEKMALAEKSKTKEAQEQISTLHKEYSDQISELVGKTRVTEEEISSLREEASKLRQERSVLIDEKNELEVSMSKKIQELEASSCSVAAAEEMASASKSRVSMPWICSYSRLEILM
jgi:regulator of replication initiation timing